MKNKWVPFVKWLYSKQEIDVSFSHGVFMEHNRIADCTLPTPPLSETDALNLFKLLEIKGLIFRLSDGSFVLNKIEEYKWNDFIRELVCSKWKRHWITKVIISISAFLIAAIVGGIVGGYMHKVGENLVGVNPVIKCSSNIPAQTTQSGGSPKQ